MAKKRKRKAKKGARKQRRAKPQAGSLPPIPDRRVMEGILRELVPATGGRGGSLEAAQQIMHQAFEAESPRRQVALARKAIQTCPDCADAYVLLAEHAETLDEALDLYEQGVAAGERALGAEGFREYEGHFWGFLETRPYMRARQGLADCLWAAGRREEAVGHCQDMLRLNPNDNQGIRYRLASALLDLQRHVELERLLQRYEEDSSAEWAYARALLAFRQEGDSERARQALKEAKKTNQHVPAYLTGSKPLPRELPEYITIGGEDEAVGYAAQFLPAWKNTPGATVWLRKTLKVPAPRPPAPRKPDWRRAKRPLAALPQVEGEVWQVDMRPFPTPIDDGGEQVNPWMLLVTNATQDTILVLELLVRRPETKEVWEHLLDALRKPREGEPHRPQQVLVRLKTFHTTWQSKLKQIGIDCTVQDELDHIEHVVSETSPQGDFAERLSRFMAPLSDEEARDVAELPQQVGEVWQADARPIQAWLEVGGEPTRPWTTLVANVSESLILATDLSETPPEREGLWKSVQKAMLQPAAGAPHRPGVVQVASDEHRQAIGSQLEAAGIECVVRDRLELIDRMVEELTEHVAGPRRLKATIDSPGVTPAMVGGLFDAAATFYRQAPWRKVPGDAPIQVQCEKFRSGTWYAVVMGQSGMTLGLAMYEDLDLLTEILLDNADDEENIRRTSGLSMTFGEAFDVAPRDFDAAQKHKWPVAGPEAYPCAIRVNPGFAFRPPLAWELELLEGSLRAIPGLLDAERAEWSGTVPTASGELPLRLSWVEEE